MQRTCRLTCPLFRLPAEQIIPKRQASDNKDQRRQCFRNEQKKRHSDPKTKKHKPQNTPHDGLLINSNTSICHIPQGMNQGLCYAFFCTFPAVITITFLCPRLLPQSPGQSPWLFPKRLSAFHLQTYSQNPEPCQEPWSPHPAA